MESTAEVGPEKDFSKDTMTSNSEGMPEKVMLKMLKLEAAQAHPRKPST